MEDGNQRPEQQEPTAGSHSPQVPESYQASGAAASPPVYPASYNPQATPVYPAQPAPGFAHPAGTVAIAPKSPGTHLIVSFLLPGVGSLMAERVGIGLLILGLWILAIAVDITVIGLIVGLPLGLGVWIWGLVDAYQGAKAWNARRGIIS